MISERVLRKWRKEALDSEKLIGPVGVGAPSLVMKTLEKSIKSNLAMTQELLDQHLLNKVKKQ